MSKHTPGPWVAEFETVGNGGWRSPDDVATIYCGEKIIATYSVSYGEYPESRDENEANARLIAAAPDLLRELIHLRRCLHPWIESGHSVPGIATLNGADAAITKATGATP